MHAESFVEIEQVWTDGFWDIQMDRQTYRHTDCKTLLPSWRWSNKRNNRFHIVVCTVNGKDADETNSGCLQLDDDDEFPAIGRSAFIY